MSALVYSFGAYDFFRVVEPADFPPWFQATLTYDYAPILDSTTAYLDTGGTVAVALEVHAACWTRDIRDGLVAMLGQVATLYKPPDTSAQAMLVAAQAHGLGDDGYWHAALTFLPR